MRLHQQRGCRTTHHRRPVTEIPCIRQLVAVRIRSCPREGDHHALIRRYIRSTHLDRRCTHQRRHRRLVRRLRHDRYHWPAHSHTRHAHAVRHARHARRRCPTRWIVLCQCRRIPHHVRIRPVVVVRARDHRRPCVIRAECHGGHRQIHSRCPIRVRHPHHERHLALDPNHCSHFRIQAHRRGRSHKRHHRELRPHHREPHRWAPVTGTAMVVHSPHLHAGQAGEAPGVGVSEGPRGRALDRSPIT